MKKVYRDVVKMIQKEGREVDGVMMVKRPFNTWAAAKIAIAMDVDLDGGHGLATYYREVRRGGAPIANVWLDGDVIHFEW